MTTSSNTLATIGSPDALPGNLLAVANPRTIKDLMGAPTSDTLVNFMRYARKTSLTAQRNEVSTRLNGLHKSKVTLGETLAKIGPSRIGEVGLTDVLDAAEALTNAGFGKYAGEARFSERDDAKKDYVFNLLIVDATKKKTDTYSRDIHTMQTTLAFDAETKKLIKQIADLDKKIEGVEQELLDVKTQFAKLDEWVEEKKAILAVRQLSALEDGQAQLEAFLGKDVVNEMLGQARS